MRNDRLISQDQLNDTKIFSDRWHWISTLPTGISFMEVGVAAGDYSEHILKTLKPSRLTLIDLFVQSDNTLARPDFKQRYYEGQNYEFVKNRFRENPNVEIIRGNSLGVLKQLATAEPKSFDVIYLDAGHKYDTLPIDITNSVAILKDNGILALNDYMAWDENGDRYDVIYAVNEFLDNNKDWYVYGIALERSMYADIYLKKRAFGQD